MAGKQDAEERKAERSSRIETRDLADAQLGIISKHGREEL